MDTKPIKGPLLQAEFYPREIHMLKSQPPAPQNVTLFGDKFFQEMIRLKGGCESGPQFNMTGVLLKGGNLFFPVKRQREGGQLLLPEP